MVKPNCQDNFRREAPLPADTSQRRDLVMIDRKMTNNQLAKQAGISLNIITRLKRDEYIAMQTIEKICIALDCGVDDILEFIPESQQ